MLTAPRIQINPHARPFNRVDQLLLLNPTRTFEVTVFRGLFDGKQVSSNVAKVKTNGITLGVAVRLFRQIETFLDSRDPQDLTLPKSTDVVDPYGFTFIPSRVLAALADPAVARIWDGKKYGAFVKILDLPVDPDKQVLGLGMIRLDEKRPIDPIDIAAAMLGNPIVVGRTEN